MTGRRSPRRRRRSYCAAPRCRRRSLSTTRSGGVSRTAPMTAIASSRRRLALSRVDLGRRRVLLHVHPVAVHVDDEVVLGQVGVVEAVAGDALAPQLPAEPAQVLAQAVGEVLGAAAERLPGAAAPAARARRAPRAAAGRRRPAEASAAGAASPAPPARASCAADERTAARAVRGAAAPVGAAPGLEVREHARQRAVAQRRSRASAARPTALSCRWSPASTAARQPPKPSRRRSPSCR